MKKLCRAISDLTDAIGGLATTIHWGLRSLRWLATKQDLEETEQNIMSKISEFAERQNAFNTRIDAAVDGLTTDVQELKKTIAVRARRLSGRPPRQREELQNSPGAITPEDQALLDDIENRTSTIVAKLEALDALTPPPPPPPPVEG